MINKEQVKHIAKLARLELSEQEISEMQKDLSGILDYFDLLKKVKKTKVSRGLTPAKSVSGQLRKDEVIERPKSLANNLVQAAPDKKDNYIKVKPIL